MSADKSVSAILAATHKTDLLLIGCGVGNRLMMPATMTLTLLSLDTSHPCLI